LTYSYDFSDCKGRVEFCIGGHTHVDYNFTSTNGIPVIICQTDSKHLRGNLYTYTAGTITESAVSAIVADYDNSMIKVIRIGRGNSFNIDLSSGVTTVYYTVMNSFTNVTSSSTITSVEANGAYNTTLTATTGTLTTVNITMGGIDITNDVYDSSTGMISISAVTGEITIIAVAEVVASSYINVLTQAVDEKGNPFNDGKGWMANSRIGKTNIYAGNQPADGFVTGHIPFTVGIDNVIRLKNVTFDKTTHNNYKYMIAFFNSSFTRITVDKDNANNAIYPTDFVSTPQLYSPVYDGNNIIQFTLTTYLITNPNIKYFAICCGGLSDESIITINEPIE
jgi:hypothetical protein